MTQITYVGPSDAVDVHTLGITAVRGQAIDVDPAVAESLLEQDIWTSSSQTPAVDVDNLDESTTKALKAFAKESGIDLQGAKNKPDVVAAIQSAVEAENVVPDVPEINDGNPADITPPTGNEGA